jgi:hypothetical protein
MNYWEFAAWIAAAAALTTAAVFYIRHINASAELNVYRLLIERIEEFGALKLSLVWNPGINRWQVADPYLKAGVATDAARILATEENWAAAVQNAVRKKRSIMETQKHTPVAKVKP